MATLCFGHVFAQPDAGKEFDSVRHHQLAARCSSTTTTENKRLQLLFKQTWCVSPDRQPELNVASGLSVRNNAWFFCQVFPITSGFSPLLLFHLSLYLHALAPTVKVAYGYIKDPCNHFMRSR